MTEGEGRNTWRTGRYSPCPRAEAGRYLAFLASLGYELSAIEQAVADEGPYTGETPPESLLGDDHNDADPVSQPARGEQDPGDAEESSDGDPPGPGAGPQDANAAGQDANAARQAAA